MNPGHDRMSYRHTDWCVNYFPVLGKLLPNTKADEAAETVGDSTGIVQTILDLAHGNSIGKREKTETQPVLQTFHAFKSEAIDD